MAEPIRNVPGGRKKTGDKDRDNPSDKFPSPKGAPLDSKNPKSKDPKPLPENNDDDVSDVSLETDKKTQLDNRKDPKNYAFSDQNWGRRILIISIIFIVILLAAFVVRPTIQGYSIYQQVAGSSLEKYANDITDIGRQLEVAQTNLSSYAVFNDKLLGQINTLTADLNQCVSEKESCLEAQKTFDQKIADKDSEIAGVQADVEDRINKGIQTQTESVNTRLEEVRIELQEKESQITDLQDAHEDFVKDVAKRVCCKAKVDNSQINYYNVIEDKLVCLEEGGTELNC